MASSLLRQRMPVASVAAEDDVVSSSSSESGNDDASSSSDVDESHLPTFTPPEFTIKELLGCIPAHLFERSAWRSGSYALGDFFMLGSFAYLASFIDSNLGFEGKAVLNGYAGLAAKWAAWNFFWLLAGWNFTGIWIVAHECGHGAFSASKTINDRVGLVLHSFVLVPYHSWRISHSKHHAATGHMTREEVFVPSTKSQKAKPKAERKTVQVNGVDLEEILEDAPIYRLYYLLVQQLFGWPAYLIMNASGQSFYPKWTNHYDPASLLFDARHRKQILLSDAGLIVMLSALSTFGYYYGIANLVKFYGIPYLYVNHWLVMITYLQHTDETLPHYRKNEWNFQRGALCTMDRIMLGPVGVFFMHSICEFHVVHHLSSKIPHYHGEEATVYLKAKLGVHYHSTDENMFVSLWKCYRSCRFVDDEGEVVFYRDAFGRAARRVEFSTPVSDSGIDVDTVSK